MFDFSNILLPNNSGTQILSFVGAVVVAIVDLVVVGFFEPPLCVVGWVSGCVVRWLGLFI